MQEPKVNYLCTSGFNAEVNYPGGAKLKMFKLFVYGTLKRGQRNHRHLADKSNGYAAFMGEARLVRPHAVVVTLTTLFATPYKAPRLLPEMPPDKPANVSIYFSLHRQHCSYFDGHTSMSLCVCMNACMLVHD